MILNWIEFYLFISLKNRNQKSKLSKRKIKRNLQKIASGQLPTTPQSSDDINKAFQSENALKNYGMTLQNETNGDGLSSTPFFKKAYASKQFQYCVFASDNIIKAIKKIPIERRQFLLDATFKVCPYGVFNQLLIIHIEHLEEVI